MNDHRCRVAWRPTRGDVGFLECVECGATAWIGPRPRVLVGGRAVDVDGLEAALRTQVQAVRLPDSSGAVPLPKTRRTPEVIARNEAMREMRRGGASLAAIGAAHGGLAIQTVSTICKGIRPVKPTAAPAPEPQ